jgi:hypothetical protein
MALSPDGCTLYPLLAGAVVGDDPQTLRMYSFDPPHEAVHRPRDPVRLETPGNAIGDLVALDDDRHLASSGTTNRAPRRGSRPST